mmetsp:Transcript_10807/g.25057  ORF Transcript_10807/g.25057 Transcript_10807/m.25057 type:complete len:218 (+) Transcript_10807:176-829(+)
MVVACYGQRSHLAVRKKHKTLFLSQKAKGPYFSCRTVKITQRGSTRRSVSLIPRIILHKVPHRSDQVLVATLPPTPKRLGVAGGFSLPISHTSPEESKNTQHVVSQRTKSLLPFSELQKRWGSAGMKKLVGRDFSFSLELASFSRISQPCVKMDPGECRYALGDDKSKTTVLLSPRVVSFCRVIPWRVPITHKKSLRLLVSSFPFPYNNDWIVSTSR